MKEEKSMYIGTVINSVLIKKQISKGGGRVFLGLDEKTNEEFVVKVVDKLDVGTSLQKGIDAENKIGLELSKNCCFLVKVREIIHRSDVIFIIMEYCPDGDLSELISERLAKNNPFSDDEVLEMCFELSTAVETIHNGGMVHRDIKPGNVFIVGKNQKNIILKLGDFGISRTINSAQKTTTLVVATIGYAPPEVLDGEGEFTPAGDVYSLGVVFVEMLDLLHPFFNEKRLIQQSRIFTGRINGARADMSPVQTSLRELALRMMSLDAKQRPSICEVLSFPALNSFLIRTYALLKERCLSQALENERLKRQLMQLTADGGGGLASAASSSSSSSSSPSSSSSSSSSSSPSSSPNSLSTSLPPSSNPKAAATPPKMTPLRMEYTANSGIDECVVKTGTRIITVKNGISKFMSFFVDREILQGIFKLVIRADLTRDTENGSYIFLGLCTAADVPDASKNPAHLTNDTCFFRHSQVWCRRRRVYEGSVFKRTPTTLFTLELDADHGGIFHLLADGVLIPHEVIGVPKSVYLGISGTFPGGVIELVSFEKVGALTPSSSSVACTVHNWVV